MSNNAKPRAGALDKRQAGSTTQPLRRNGLTPSGGGATTGQRQRRKVTRGNPNDPDYALDGRKGAEAAKHVIGALILAGCTSPSGGDIVAAVANHPASAAAIVYRQSMGQRLRSATSVYFRMFGAPERCRLVGADYVAADCRFDLVWQTPSEAIVIEELMVEPHTLPSTSAGAARIEDLVTAARLAFGAAHRGGRACVLFKPSLSVAWDSDGNELAVEELDLS